MRVYSFHFSTFIYIIGLNEKKIMFTSFAVHNPTAGIFACLLPGRWAFCLTAFLFAPQARRSHTLPPSPVCVQCRRSHQKNLSSVAPALFRGLFYLSENRLISAPSHSVYFVDFIFSALAGKIIKPCKVNLHQVF